MKKVGFFDRFVKKKELTYESEIMQNRFAQLRDAVYDSFSNLNKDISLQKQWITYLNNINSALRNSHDKHKDLTKKDIDELKRWINFLHDNSIEHEKTVKAIEDNMKKTLNEYNKYILELHKKMNEVSLREHEIKKLILDEVNNTITAKHNEIEGKITNKIEQKQMELTRTIDQRNMELNKSIEQKQNEINYAVEQKTSQTAKIVKDVLDQHLLDTNNQIKFQVQSQIKEQVPEHIRVVDSKLKKVIDERNSEIEKHMNDSLNNHVKLTQKQINEIHSKIEAIPTQIQPQAQPQMQIDPNSLTAPEQKLLNLLMSEPDPVSYAHIAEKTGNSVNTVRVIMNNLKKRGFIEEHVLPSGVKLFNASNKEKIKKLYNIGHL